MAKENKTKKVINESLKDLFESKKGYSTEVKLNDKYTMVISAYSLTNRDLTESVKNFDKELLEDNIKVDVFDELDLVYHLDNLPLNSLKESIINKVCKDLGIKRVEEKSRVLTEGKKKDKVRFVGNPEKEMAAFNHFMGEDYEEDERYSFEDNEELQPYFDVELRDDETAYGGTSYDHETLFDFLCEMGADNKTTLSEVNDALRQCGILPIDTEEVYLDDEAEGIESIPELKNLSREKLAEIAYKLFGVSNYNFYDEDDAIVELDTYISNHKGDDEVIEKIIDLAHLVNEGLEEGRARKWIEVQVLQGNYGYGWDDLCEYEIPTDWEEAKKVYKEIKDDVKAYKENEPQYAHRVVTRKKPINNTSKEEKSNTDENKGLKEDKTELAEDESCKKKDDAIKIKSGKKVAIEKPDTSKAGEEGNPIQKGLKGRTGKLEGLKEDIDEWDNDFDICCKDVADGLDGGLWHGQTSSERNWGLTVNGKDGNQFSPAFADAIAYECSYPVRDGYFSFVGLDCVPNKSTFYLTDFDNESDRETLKNDLLSVGCSEEEIDKFFNGDDNAEIEFYIDYVIDIDDLEDFEECLKKNLKEAKDTRIKLTTKDGKEVFIDTQYGDGYQVCAVDGFGNYNPWQEMITKTENGVNYVTGFKTMTFPTKEAAKDFIVKQYGEVIEEKLNEDDGYHEKCWYELTFEDGSKDKDYIRPYVKQGWSDEEIIEYFQDYFDDKIVSIKEIGWERDDNSGVSFREDLNQDLTDLAKDEQEAIDGYDKVINKQKGKKIAKNLKHIRDEEDAHLDYLNKAKTNPDLDYEHDELEEDTVKQGNAWVNKGKEGTHGKFKTKKEADAQRKAMFSQGFKEGLEEDLKVEDVLGWLEDHEQAYKDFKLWYKKDKMPSLEDVKDWLSDHEELSKDFENYFKVKLEEEVEDKYKIEYQDDFVKDDKGEVRVFTKDEVKDFLDGVDILEKNNYKAVAIKEGMKDRLDAYVKSLDKKEIKEGKDNLIGKELTIKDMFNLKDCAGWIFHSGDDNKCWGGNSNDLGLIDTVTEDPDISDSMVVEELIPVNTPWRDHPLYIYVGKWANDLTIDDIPEEEIQTRDGLIKDIEEAWGIKEGLKEAKEKDTTTFYSLELGVLLPEDDSEYDSYAVAFDKKHAYYDEEHLESLDEQELINNATEYINSGVPRTYGVVSKIEVDNFDGIEDVIAEMNENGFIEESVDFFNGEQYRPENVVWSGMKDDDETIVLDFVEIPGKEKDDEVEVKETETETETKVEEESLKEDYEEDPYDSDEEKLLKRIAKAIDLPYKPEREDSYDNGNYVSLLDDFNNGRGDEWLDIFREEKLDKKLLKDYKRLLKCKGDCEDFKLEEDASSMKDKVERSTVNYTKDKGQIMCNKGQQESEVLNLLRKKYKEVTSQKGKAGSVAIKYSGKKLKEEIEDKTADELAYERYKNGEYTYDDYLTVCDQEGCEPLPKVKETVEEKPEEDKWTNDFIELLDLIEFDLEKHDDADEDEKWSLIDKQGANLGDIEGDRFGDASGVLDRLDIYIEDYIIDDLDEILDKLDDVSTEGLNTWEDYLNWYNTIGKEKYAEELGTSAWDFEVLDLILNHAEDVDIEKAYKIINGEVEESLKEWYTEEQMKELIGLCNKLGIKGFKEIGEIKKANNLTDEGILDYLRKKVEGEK